MQQRYTFLRNNRILFLFFVSFLRCGTAENAVFAELAQRFARVAHMFFMAAVPLQREIKNAMRMELSIILSVALAATMIVVVLVLIAIIVYLRWQIGDKNATLGRFIDENEKMRIKIEKTGIM